MTPINDWITDRRPTEADGVRAGLVLAQYHPDNDGFYYMHWSYVGEATPWKRCASWQPPTAPEPAPTPTPRKFASLTRTVTDFGHVIDAIDEDGVAWWMITSPDGPEPEWHQLTPLPGREVMG